MPHDPNHRGHDIEQLSRKIERMLSGQPNPLLDDHTEELAEIARLLHEHLPDDLPDPGFRAQLKQDLIDPQPRLVTFAPRRRGRRYPVPVLAGALAVVMLATAATGWMAFDPPGSNSDDVAGAEVPTMTLSATGSSVAAVAFATRTASEQLRGSDDTLTRPSPTPAEADTNDDPEPSPTVAPATNTPVTLSPSRPTEPATGEPTPELMAAKLPPVDREHVELGALATAGPEATGEFDDVTFELSGTLPRLEQQAPAYHFATPYVDSRMILRGIGDFLGIDQEPRIDDFDGKQAYILASDDSDASFTWFPSSGAFTCTLHDVTAADDPENIGASAVAWLRDFGFPVNPDQVQPVVQTMDDGQRIVHVPLGELPEPAMGHPLRVSLVIDEQGRIAEVSGYWLQETGTVNVPLLSAEDAWRALISGEGYWPDRPAAGEPGRFVIEEFNVSYMLTVGDAGDQLVLQPVIKASGLFHPQNGEPASSVIYLRAAVNTAES